MATNTEALQVQCRALTTSVGTFNEDLYAALQRKFPTLPFGTLDDMLGNVPGGLVALLANPALLI
jgi:hypothetical protein